MNAETQAMLDQLEAIKQEGASIAAGLSDAQFNWRPGPERWSIGQNLNHLNVGDLQVLPAFDRAIAEGRAKGKTASGPFRYGWFSRFMIREMEPPPRRRIKTPLKGSAGADHRPDAVLVEFARVRDELARRVRDSDGLDLAGIRTISPVNRLIRLPLGAYFAFILAHDRRHLWQARQVRVSPDFPAR
ncbi:MAG TPA: DinB family protein [Gemmatimonadales bacterium]|nr:DinB family protein [Gemmatimonadales bacterium]